ncbi:MAG: hypothetical protein FD174_3679 [Geobacteraceae bacterium]|nr:MAG: hypothetical protein FD174_3679 [Geobacteraceae bacterium]
MITRIRRFIALSLGTVLIIMTIGRYRFNTTGLPTCTEKSLFKRIAVTFKIGKGGRKERRFM